MLGVGASGRLKGSIRVLGAAFWYMWRGSACQEQIDAVPVGGAEEYRV